MSTPPDNPSGFVLFMRLLAQLLGVVFYGALFLLVVLIIVGLLAAH